MKISKAQKEQNRKNLLQAAIQLISDKGLVKASMKDIALQAGLSEAAIYKYFPSKEQLLYAIYTEFLTLAFQSRATDFESLQTQEKLHELTENYLSELSKNKKFVLLTYESIFFNSMGRFNPELNKMRQIVSSEVEKILITAEKQQSIKAIPFRKFVADLYWDFLIGISSYWLKDNSELQSNTTELLDRSLSLLLEVLKTPLMQRCVDIGYFLVKEHILSSLTNAQRE